MKPCAATHSPSALSKRIARAARGLPRHRRQGCVPPPCALHGPDRRAAASAAASACAHRHRPAPGRMQHAPVDRGQRAPCLRPARSADSRSCPGDAVHWRARCPAVRIHRQSQPGMPGHPVRRGLRRGRLRQRSGSPAYAAGTSAPPRPLPRRDSPSCGSCCRHWVRQASRCGQGGVCESCGHGAGRPPCRSWSACGTMRTPPPGIRAHDAYGQARRSGRARGTGRRRRCREPAACRRGARGSPNR